MPEKFDAIDKEEAAGKGGGVKLEHQSMMHGIMSAPGCVRLQINVDRQQQKSPFLPLTATSSYFDTGLKSQKN